MNITFGSNVDKIGFDFAVNSATPALVTLTALPNGMPVGTVAAAASFSFPGAQSPEGHIASSGPSFNSVALTSTAYDFAIDNVTALSAAAAPEPATAALLALSAALTGLSAVTSRRRKR